ncbi:MULTISPECIES: tRNA lysidine(34) synthetase TilS [unclassified Rhizobium]|uniref:tRNA lysidine(34) synthetase TilS n=1 Tax=unclassified Rhizobium TaxID=2613769 RepID=UPI001ADBEB88|nr:MULTISPECIES: tRNA lysidine(34) synthetase TilS [unclassified Rhizobium]MBO9099353.1 tRNA lysidine(34) synthetase TilS [Rhizobium sp. L58/93]QXZ85694.1 tRNA lysidine(34) synthetase TilS [Rhizobium sp. K1/93]QXZ90166.1 tRNA lysidine(34) synthetase TilS [Rhizobium sp. K15/93]
MAGGPVSSPQAAAARLLASLRQPSHILVAISGGSDSTGLLIALADAIRDSHPSHRLSAATVDHDLRPGSADEAKSVANVCRKLGIAHSTRRWLGEKPATGIMAAAREARYSLLADVAAEVQADLIVTGHTLDDQQETLAMRTARVRAGRVSATGIADAVLFDRRIWVVRPFLSCLRNDIRAFLTERNIGWIDDPSNLDLHYERVRVRAGLATGNFMASDGGGSAKADLSSAAARWVEQSVVIEGGLLCRISPEGIDAAAPEFAYGLSCLAAIFGGQPYGLGQERMERVLGFIDTDEPGRRTAGGVVFDLRRNGLFLMRESRNIDALHLAPGARGIWDGRFEVFNDGHGGVQIVAAGATSRMAFAAGTPKGAAMRAAASAPTIRFDDEDPRYEHYPVRFAPYLAPFDRFLTRFDLSLADRLADAFGRSAYVSPPF